MKILLPIILILASTNLFSQTKYPFAIRDFPEAVRPHLEEIVSSGWGFGKGDEIDSVNTHLNDEYLLNLTLSEHPFLRSIALTLALDRRTINVDSLLLNHLDDTAKCGRYSRNNRLQYIYVSDVLIRNFSWREEKDKRAFIKLLVNNHNYLMTAYEALEKLDTLGGLYDVVKAMAERTVRDYYYRSIALKALASYNRAVDIEFLFDQLSNYWLWGENDYSILRQHKNKYYFSLLEHAWEPLHRKYICDESWDAYFLFDAIASYKTKKSAKILKLVFYHAGAFSISRDKNEMFKRNLYGAIMDNQCPLYSDMISKIKAIRKAEEIEEAKRRRAAKKNQIIVQDVQLEDIKREPVERPIKWN